jgi:hypothetical protein
MNLDAFAMRNSRWLKIIFSMLPSWIIRYTFLASLAAATRAVNLEDKQARASLNDILHLVNKDESLSAVAMVSNTVWSCSDIAPADLGEEELRGQVERLVERTPDWARYDEPQVMVRDALAMFEFSRHAPLSN